MCRRRLTTGGCAEKAALCRVLCGKPGMPRLGSQRRELDPRARALRLLSFSTTHPHTRQATSASIHTSAFASASGPASPPPSARPSLPADASSRVAIVGGGPTGLALALLLSRLGTKSLVVERSRTLVSHPQAHVTNRHGMETLRAAAPGLAAAVALHAPPLETWRRFAYLETLLGDEPPYALVDHFPRARAGSPDASGAGDYVESPEPVAHLAQHRLHRLLARAVELEGPEAIRVLTGVRVDRWERREGAGDGAHAGPRSGAGAGGGAPPPPAVRLTFSEVDAAEPDGPAGPPLLEKRTAGFSAPRSFSPLDGAASEAPAKAASSPLSSPPPLGAAASRSASFSSSFPFAVACDGARSGLRDAARVSMSGPGAIQHLLNVHFFSKELAEGLEASGRGAMLTFCYGPQAVVVLVTHDLRDGEFVAQIPIFPPLQRHWSVAEAERALRGALGRDVAVQVKSARTWTMAARVADTYVPGLHGNEGAGAHDRAGGKGGDDATPGSGGPPTPPASSAWAWPAALAGDAAHAFPPAGAFGLNTGLGDAHGLAWRIAAIVREQELLRTGEGEEAGGLGSADAPDAPSASSPPTLPSPASFSALSTLPTAFLSPSALHLLSTYTLERRSAAVSAARLSVRNFREELRLPRLLGLDYDVATATAEAVHDLPIASTDLKKKALGALMALGRAPLELARLARADALRARLARGDTLRLLFPREDLGHVYERGALRREPADGPALARALAARPRDAPYEPTTLPGARFPHAWVELRAVEDGRVVEDAGDGGGDGGRGHTREDARDAAPGRGADEAPSGPQTRADGDLPSPSSPSSSSAGSSPVSPESTVVVEALAAPACPPAPLSRGPLTPSEVRARVAALAGHLPHSPLLAGLPPRPPGDGVVAYGPPGAAVSTLDVTAGAGLALVLWVRGDEAEAEAWVRAACSDEVREAAMGGAVQILPVVLETWKDEQARAGAEEASGRSEGGREPGKGADAPDAAPRRPSLFSSLFGSRALSPAPPPSYLSARIVGGRFDLEAPVVLVRPDGIVAWRAERGQGIEAPSPQQALVAAVRTVLGGQ